jgi:hypothetical protein|tara:strand:- start:751 stop:1146 length:396 start_codon:yes stop_codon:yes gene_type:complete
LYGNEQPTSAVFGIRFSVFDFAQICRWAFVSGPLACTICESGIRTGGGQNPLAAATKRNACQEFSLKACMKRATTSGLALAACCGRTRLCSGSIIVWDRCMFRLVIAKIATENTIAAAATVRVSKLAQYVS